MKITNNLNLPEVMFKFLQSDFYDHSEASGTLSATTTLKPVQEVVLTERYKDQIEVDCSDRVWSLFGSGVHAVLEKSLETFYSKEDIKQEERLKLEMLGETISGKFDLILKNTLHDFKVTSAFTLQYNSRLEEWIQQLSIYRYLYFKVKGVLLDEKACIVAILRDWTAKNLATRNYPDSPIKEVSLKLMSIEETEKLLTEKIKEIQRCRKLKDHELPTCSDEERWKNKKTGEYNKCAKYCACKTFCKQALKDA